MRSSSKGKRCERQVVRLARAAGLPANRCWETAQSPDAGERVRDVKIGSDYYQVQVSRDGFGRVYAELRGVRGFFFKADRKEWLIAVKAADYLRLLKRQKTP